MPHRVCGDGGLASPLPAKHRVTQTSTGPAIVEVGPQASHGAAFSLVSHPDAAGLPELWQSLRTHAKTPFQQYEWTAAAAETLCPPGHLRLIAIDTGAQSAVLPLVRRWRGGPQLELLSSREMYEPMDALCANRSSAGALAEVLLALRNPLFLTRVPEDSDLTEALRAVRFPGRVAIEDAPGCPWLPLDPSWSDPESHFSSRRRGDVRRARRNAESLGGVTFEWHTPGPESVAPLLDQAFTIEAAGWKGQAGTALLVDPARGPFYRRFAAAAAASRRLHLTFLRIGGEYAAMQLMASAAGRLWLLKIGYAPQFFRCSPGLLLMIKTVARAADDGWIGYEFLGTEEPWLRLWDARIRRCVTLRIYPSSLRGRLARLIDRIVP